MSKKITTTLLLIILAFTMSTEIFAGKKHKTKTYAKKSTANRKLKPKKLSKVKQTVVTEEYRIVEESGEDDVKVSTEFLKKESATSESAIVKTTTSGVIMANKAEGENPFAIMKTEEVEKKYEISHQKDVEKAVQQAAIDANRAQIDAENSSQKISSISKVQNENKENVEKITDVKEEKREKRYDYVAEILVDENGKILTGTNTDYIHPIASLTKMMTALLTLEKIKSGEISFDSLVTVPKEATLLGESSSGLRAGEKVKIEDLLKCAIVKSGNDAAYTLAKFVGNTEEEFVKMMNRKAESLRMRNTTYYTSTGLPAKYYRKARIVPLERDYDTSTVSDIGILASEILKYPKYLEISSQYLMKVKDGKIKLRNRNSLVAKYEGVDGLKTGFHTKAHYNIAVSSKKDGVRLIAVVFGSPTLPAREAEVIRLLDEGYENLGIAKLERKHAVM